MIRKVLEVVMAKLFGFVPKFDFKFPSLRETDPDKQSQIDERNTNILNGLYDRGLLTPHEISEMLKKKGIVTVDMAASQLDYVDPPVSQEKQVDTTRSIETFNAVGR